MMLMKMHHHHGDNDDFLFFEINTFVFPIPFETPSKTCHDNHTFLWFWSTSRCPGPLNHQIAMSIKQQQQITNPLYTNKMVMRSENLRLGRSLGVTKKYWGKELSFELSTIRSKIMLWFENREGKQNQSTTMQCSGDEWVTGPKDARVDSWSTVRWEDPFLIINTTTYNHTHLVMSVPINQVMHQISHLIPWLISSTTRNGTSVTLCKHNKNSMVATDRSYWITTQHQYNHTPN